MVLDHRYERNAKIEEEINAINNLHLLEQGRPLVKERALKINMTLVAYLDKYLNSLLPLFKNLISLNIKFKFENNYESKVPPT